MTDKKYDVDGICPNCGKKQTLAITANEALPIAGSDAKALEAGQAPKAIAHCEGCGKDYQAPVSADTCAEWDDFCQAVHPIVEY